MASTQSSGENSLGPTVSSEGARDSDASAANAQPGKKPAMSEEQRLEEGLEETFPASDPVSAKHID